MIYSSFRLPSAISFLFGTSGDKICHRDGGQTMYFARAVIKPNETGPNVLLSNERPV